METQIPFRLQFDIEAWDASTSSQAADPGEAAFDVTIEIDSGNGFRTVSGILEK